MNWLRFFSLLFLITSCGDIQKPIAYHAPLVAPQELTRYPRRNWRFVNNKFFIWRDKMIPKDASRVFEISRQIDKLDAIAIGYHRQAQELEVQTEPLKSQKKAVQTQVKALKKEQAAVSTKTIETQKTIDETEHKLNEEVAKPNADPTVVSELREKLAYLKGQIDILTAIESFSPEKSQRKTSPPAKLVTALLDWIGGPKQLEV